MSLPSQENLTGMLSDIMDRQISQAFNEINLKVRSVERLSRKEILEKYYPPRTMAFFLSKVSCKSNKKLTKAFDGVVLLALTIEDMTKLLEIVHGPLEHGSFGILNERIISLSKGVLENLLGASINALEQFLNARISVDATETFPSFGSYIPEIVSADLSEEAKNVLIEAGMEIEGTAIKGFFIVVVPEEALGER